MVGEHGGLVPASLHLHLVLEIPGATLGGAPVEITSSHARNPAALLAP